MRCMGNPRRFASRCSTCILCLRPASPLPAPVATTTNLPPSRSVLAGKGFVTSPRNREACPAAPALNCQHVAVSPSHGLATVGAGVHASHPSSAAFSSVFTTTRDMSHPRKRASSKTSLRITSVTAVSLRYLNFDGESVQGTEVTGRDAGVPAVGDALEASADERPRWRLRRFGVGLRRAPLRERAAFRRVVVFFPPLGRAVDARLVGGAPPRDFLFLLPVRAKSPPAFVRVQRDRVCPQDPRAATAGRELRHRVPRRDPCRWSRHPRPSRRNAA